MAKGIIFINNIPQNCFYCKFKKRPFGFSFEEDMICEVTGQSVYQYKPHNIFGNKPDWCPIKPLSKEVEMQSFCCGTCKYHVPSEVPGDGDWVCDNAESEYYGIETGNADGCMDYEERE